MCYKFYKELHVVASLQLFTHHVHAIFSNAIFPAQTILLLAMISQAQIHLHTCVHIHKYVPNSFWTLCYCSTKQKKQGLLKGITRTASVNENECSCACQLTYLENRFIICHNDSNGWCIIGLKVQQVRRVADRECILSLKCYKAWLKICVALSSLILVSENLACPIWPAI